MASEEKSLFPASRPIRSGIQLLIRNRKIRIRSLFWNEARIVKGSKREFLLAKVD